MSRFFIDRPVFAWVLAIVVMLAGVLALQRLPVAVYPSLASPSVAIFATYPGASARTLEDTVTQVIEQQMNGIDNLDYIASNSSGSGQAVITLTFKQGTNPDIAQVQVQNKLQAAMPLLPPEVQQQGLRVNKASKSFLMVLTASSTDGSMKSIDVGNFIASTLQDPVGRVSGVGQVQLLGTQYAMRIWMQPDKLYSFGLTPVDLIRKISEQNVQVVAGQLGGAPAVQGQRLNATVMAQSRFQTPEQFGNILLRVNSDGSQVRLRDVARIERSGENYNMLGTYNTKPAAALAITAAPGANALATAEAVKARVKELAPYFPPGIEIEYPYDLTPFVRISIREVIKTLVEAIGLVFAVMFLFLQNWRATLIPAITVPVVLLGTFAVMSIAGFSINILTLFGLVLAMGLLVDDAIVVVENVERLMREEKLAPLPATRKAMSQITGALIGVGIVLVAVFVPMSFLQGSSGAIYRQFTLTMVSAMVLSVLVAMILTPALCATILTEDAVSDHSDKRKLFARFNRGFEHLSLRYQQLVAGLIPKPRRVFAVYSVIVAAVIYLFASLPTSFIPDEDQGFLANVVMLPVGSTLEQTQAVMDKIRDHYLNDEASVVKEVFYVTGFSWAGQGQNVGQMFTALKPWDERRRADQSVNAISSRAMAFFGTLREAQAIAINPSPVQELGNATGFDLQLQDKAGLGHDALMAARNQLLGMARTSDKVTRVRPNGLDDTPMFQLDIDQERASVHDIELADAYATLTAAFGSSYVNDFVDSGRVKKVYLMGDASARMQPEDLGKWYVRNRSNEMVPFSSFARTHWTYGSPKLERFNGVPSVQIQGVAAPGKSTGDAMQALEAMVAQLPAGIGLEWSGMSHEERQSGQQTPMLYTVSVLVIFLCLAALYESWAIPLAVILVVPLGVLGALCAAKLIGLSNDVYFRVGLLTTVGLAAKNAILVVEFAKHQYEQGASLSDAAMTAVRLRLRPIIMTSMAFLFGVLPLAVSSGAGAASRNAIGLGVSGGLLAATFLVIFFIPVFFVAIMGMLRRKAPSTIQPVTMP